MVKYFSDIKSILFIVSQIFIIWENRLSKYVLMITAILVIALFGLGVKYLANKTLPPSKFWLNTLYCATMLSICTLSLF